MAATLADMDQQTRRPSFMSKFGDWYLRLPDGATDELSVVEGTYNRIASAPEEFAALVNSREWQEDHLMSLQVLELHSRGLVPGPNHCYAFAPHPTVVGRIDLDQAMLMDIGAWQHICADLLLKTR
jgi:hypothetical protein